MKILAMAIKKKEFSKYKNTMAKKE